MDAGRPTRFTTTGPIFSGAGMWFGALLTAAGDAASATFRYGGASGEIVTVLKAGIGTSASFLPGVAMPCSDLHVTLTGTTPELAVVL